MDHRRIPPEGDPETENQQDRGRSISPGRARPTARCERPRRATDAGAPRTLPGCRGIGVLHTPGAELRRLRCGTSDLGCWCRALPEPRAPVAGGWTPGYTGLTWAYTTHHPHAGLPCPWALDRSVMRSRGCVRVVRPLGPRTVSGVQAAIRKAVVDPVVDQKPVVNYFVLLASKLLPWNVRTDGVLAPAIGSTPKR
jgi:hypothetical protein